MKEFIQQPNGKYCDIGYNGKIRFVNYTEQDIIDLYIQQAKDDMKNAKRPGEIIKRLVDNNCSVENQNIQDMGFNKPYDELIKYVPREPVGQLYVGCEFTTFGKCPTCGKNVQNGMGGKDERCRDCGQLLNW